MSRRNKMGIEFRSTSKRAFVFLVILCSFLSCPRCSTASQQAKRKPNFNKIKLVLPFLQKKPLFHDKLLDWNLTNQQSATRYMLNLYKNLNRVDTEDNSQSFNVSNVTTTTKSLQGADTIMGIQNDATDNRIKASSFHMRVKFNFTAKITFDEKVEAAEFHIYKDAPHFAWMTNASFLVELSVTIIPGSPTKLKKMLNTRYIQGWKTGWEIFDVTKTVDMWIVSPGNNYGLELSVKFLRDEFPIPVDPARFGFVGFKGPYGKRPFIVSFFKGDPTDKIIKIHASSRKRRSMFNPGNLKYGNTAPTNLCKKRHLYVDFHELSWQNWIIAPDGYESFYCAGECSWTHRPYNSTNHAIVQTLVNLLNPYSAPGPCCVPTKLTAISVLYYDEKKNIVLKKFKNMVVKTCGCH